MRIGTCRAAATLLGLVLLAPVAAAAADPTDPEFRASHTWTSQIKWSAPSGVDVAYPTIAVVDSGMWSGFDDFAGYLDDESADCLRKAKAVPISDVTGVEDTVGHGTKVATLAAAPANGKGSVGVSPDSHVIVVRVTDDENTVSNASVECAFRYLTEIAKRGELLIVNLSFSAFSTPASRKALADLIKAGALVVAASGNETKIDWPAKEPHVLAVGRPDGGATGAELDLVAPGSGLRLPVIGGGWKTGSDTGTSFAAPIVAGVAARVWGKYGEVLNPQVIAYLLREHATRSGPRFAASRGFGAVNLAGATSRKATSLPRIEEFEPNDGTATAMPKAACTRTCTLRGLVVDSDDKVDYWRLTGRRSCPKPRNIRVKSSVTANCFRIRGKVYAKVQRKAGNRAQQLYTVTIPRR